MAPRSETLPENSCKQCAKEFKTNVKTSVICSKCSSKYHPNCILKIHGIYVDKGNVICCDDITSKKFECEKKEQEIQELKSRIRRLNEMDYEVSISQQDSINIEITEGSDNKVESNDERKDSEEMTTLETKRDMEVTYLNKLLQEKADMVEELRDKIKILNKYISVLERGEKVNTKVQPSLRENPNINNACAITKKCDNI